MRLNPVYAVLWTVILNCLFSISGMAQNIVVPNLDNAKIEPLANRGQKATVLLFTTHDCPIANKYAPEIERIYQAYRTKQVTFFLVYVDGSLTATEAKKHRNDYKLTLPAVFDTKHHLVKRAQAVVTPEAAVFSSAGKLIYRGRIDDRAVDFGKVRVNPTRKDLRIVLDSFLSGKPVTPKTTRAVGCFIADLPTR